MFDFKSPKDAGYQEALEQARLINGARSELRAARRRGMLEFADAAHLDVAITERIAALKSERPA